MLLPVRIYIALSPWYFKDFLNISLLNIGDDQTKILTSERGGPGTVPYDKSSLVIALRS